MPLPAIPRPESMPRVTNLWIYDQYNRRLLEHQFLDCAVEVIEAGADIISGFYESANFCRTWQMWIDTGVISAQLTWVIPKIRVASKEGRNV